MSKGTVVATIGRGRVYNPTPRVVQMTPELAEKILENNTLNRSLASGRVERYARDMARGAWKMNGETVKMTAEGDLLDGQHRLFAVIESGVTVPMLVVEGLDKDAMPTIDTGKPRSFGDVLAIEKRANTTALASAVRWLYWHESQPRPSSLSALKSTHSELHALLEENPDFIDRASEANSRKKARKILSPAILTFVYAMAYRVDPAKAGAWLNLLDTGTDMDERHPIYQLRERMNDNRAAKAKLPGMEVCALAVKSWQQFITGRRTSTLTWRSTEQFPSFYPQVVRQRGARR